MRQTRQVVHAINQYFFLRCLWLVLKQLFTFLKCAIPLLGCNTELVILRSQVRVQPATAWHLEHKNKSGNTKGGSITVPLTFCLTGLDYCVWQIKTKIVSCHTAYSKPVKQEVNGTVILPPLVFPE
jgi:hypothetical protein